MGNKCKALILAAAAAIAIILGIGKGSVSLPPLDILQILKSFIFGSKLPEEIDSVYYGVVTGIRLPRVLTAFFAGAALALSGTIMQSVLKNPLASSYGLGVSSGAGLGAAVVMIYGSAAGVYETYVLPTVGTVCGFATVVMVIGMTYMVDRSLSDNTIILAGMILSLFLNAIMDMLAAANPEHTHQILLWQLGSFAGRDYTAITVLAIVVAVCLIFFMRFNRELDIMTFGEETAMSLGVDTKKCKWILIAITAVLTGTAVSFVGVIGFVDLIAPHVVRRFFGASHRWVLPMSALFGGAFMVLCDLAGRTLAAPSEIPVGAITALIGAPFFVYIYFVSRKK